MVLVYQADTLKLGITGKLTVLLTDEDGNTRIVGAGNTPCQALLNAIAGWIVGTNNTGQNPLSPPTQLILGTGSGTPSVTDKSLFAAQTGTQSVINARTATANTATLTMNYAKGQLNGTYTEAGLLDASGNLMAHLIFQSPLEIANTEAATFIWTITVNAG